MAISPMSSCVPLVEEKLGERERSEFELIGQVMVATGHDEAQIAASVVAVKAQLAFYGSTPAYRPVLEHHGLGALGDELNTLSKRGQWAAMGELIDDATFEHFSVRGTPQVAGAELARRFGDRYDRLSLSFMAGADASLAGEVVSAARAAIS